MVICRSPWQHLWPPVFAMLTWACGIYTWGVLTQSYVCYHHSMISLCWVVAYDPVYTMPQVYIFVSFYCMSSKTMLQIWVFSVVAYALRDQGQRCTIVPLWRMTSGTRCTCLFHFSVWLKYIATDLCLFRCNIWPRCNATMLGWHCHRFISVAAIACIWHQI